MRKPTKIEAALLAVIESATETMYEAFRVFGSLPEWRHAKQEEAYGIYYGAWQVALVYNIELPRPTDWRRWAIAAAEEEYTRRQESRHAA